MESKKIEVEPYGRIHKGAMFLRQYVGAAEDEDGGGYEMSVNVAGQHPIVTSKKTGNIFTLNWNDIVNMAVKAGIDREDVFDGEADESDS